MKYKQTITSYDRTESGKSWRSKPYSVEVKYIDERTYSLLTDPDTARAFRRAGSRCERREKSYTFHGYIVTKATTINPSNDDKTIREFEPLGEVTHRLTHKKSGNTVFTVIDKESCNEKLHRVVKGFLPDNIVAIPTARAAKLGYKVEKFENL